VSANVAFHPTEVLEADFNIAVSTTSIFKHSPPVPISHTFEEAKQSKVFTGLEFHELATEFKSIAELLFIMRSTIATSLPVLVLRSS
jgi:hypothetical protein